MLQLAHDQLAVIDQALLAERIVELLCASFPETAGALDVETLAQQVQQQVVRARACGFMDGPHVFRFVLAAWILGPGFDEKIGILRTMLHDAALPAALRAERLERAVLDTLAALSHDTSSTSSEVIG